MRDHEREDFWALFADLFASLAIVFLVLSVGMLPMSHGGGASNSQGCTREVEDLETSIRVGLADEYLQAEWIRDLISKIPKEAALARESEYFHRVVNDGMTISGRELLMESFLEFETGESDMTDQNSEDAVAFCGLLAKLAALHQDEYKIYIRGHASPKFCGVLDNDEKALIRDSESQTPLRAILGDDRASRIPFEMRHHNIWLANDRAATVTRFCGDLDRDSVDVYFQGAEAPLPGEDEIRACGFPNRQDEDSNQRTVYAVYVPKDCN